MIYRSLLRPILFSLPPETVHELALHSLSLGLKSGTARHFVTKRFERSPFGQIERFGLTFSNPVGLAAGFDKNGIALPGLAALGFGFIEAGTVTSQPQPGNLRPRLFRLPLDKALINRAGFNNDGATKFVASVKQQRPNCVLGVSIGKSKVVPIEAAVTDYLNCFETVYSVADYIAVNVSSPNTPGLRELQKAEHLANLLEALQTKNRELTVTQGRSRPMPLLVKLAPDLGQDDLEMIVDVATRAQVSGIIATNTTVGRSGLQTPPERVKACGEGGLSGAPLQHQSTQMIADLCRLTRGAMTLIGVGGIFTAADAWAKICAGASLLQLYTGFIYEGPAVARTINEGLFEIMSREGFSSLDEAVGSRAI